MNQVERAIRFAEQAIKERDDRIQQLEEALGYAKRVADAALEEHEKAKREMKALRNRGATTDWPPGWSSPQLRLALDAYSKYRAVLSSEAATSEAPEKEG